MTDPITPIFLFSLPRAGSTLLQRAMAAHSRVVTSSEPWLLLPLLGVFSRSHVFADYSQDVCARAMEDFCRAAGGGKEVYRQQVRELALSMYGRIADSNHQYFVDKTPRYHMIIDEIHATFEEAKIIFLTRHPLAVAASMSRSFLNGSWDLSPFHVDLYQGLENIVAGLIQYSDRAFTVRYEDLVTNPDETMCDLFRFLDLESEANLWQQYAETKLDGQFGDKLGNLEHTGVTATRIDRWKESITTPLRREWCRRYLAWIGAERLQLMGYERAHLEQELDEIGVSSRGLMEDAVRYCYGRVRVLVEPRILRKKYRLWRADRKRGLFTHN